MVNKHLLGKTNDEYKFLKVTCKEGHYITNWDKEDILEYHSAKIMYTPLNADLSKYYCVTEEENAQYNEDREKAEEQKRIEEEKKREEERNNH